MAAKRLARIPLVPSLNQRNIDASVSSARDQALQNAWVTIVPNPLTDKSTAYTQKRPGFATAGTISLGNAGLNIAPGSWITVFSVAAAPTVFFGTDNCGVTIGTPLISEAGIAGAQYGLFNDSDGWYLPFDALDPPAPTTFTADILNGSPTLSNVSSFTSRYVGQLLTNANITVGTRIQSMNTGGGTITMTANAIGTAAASTITASFLAKIIDADFPALPVGYFVEMDGYLFIAAGDRIYQSDINSVTSWGAANFITANMDMDNIITVARYRNQIVAFGSNSIEWFYNAGNPSGSVLSPTKQAFSRIGISGFGTARQRPITVSGDNIFWIKYETTNAIRETSAQRFGVFTMADFTPKKISTEVVDAILASNQGANNVYDLCTFVITGRRFLLVHSSSVSLIYDLEANQWAVSGFLSDIRMGESGYAVRTSNTSGLTFSINPASPTYQDAGSAYTMTIRFSDSGFGASGPTHVVMVRLIADTQASGTTTLEASDDDGQNYFTLGTFDMTQEEKSIWIGGFYYGHRMWRLTHSANTAWRGQFLDLYGMAA